VTNYSNSHSSRDRGRIYDIRYRAKSDMFYFESFERPLLDQIFAELGTSHPGRYLDVACGTGRILGIALPHFSESIGLDISEEMLAEARKKFPTARFIRRDATSGPTDIGSFEVITLFRFILNAEAGLRSATLSWIRGVIAPDGVLVLNNHLNSRSLLGRILSLRNRQLRSRRHAILSNDEVKKLLHDAGFEVIKSYGFAFIPVIRGKLPLPPAWLYPLEHFLQKFQILQEWGKDQVYLCRPE
jgi:ubiquinone/menaquinone biosynthesis C-methylase UbiE